MDNNNTQYEQQQQLALQFDINTERKTLEEADANRSALVKGATRMKTEYIKELKATDLDYIQLIAKEVKLKEAKAQLVADLAEVKQDKEQREIDVNRALYDKIEDTKLDAEDAYNLIKEGVVTRLSRSVASTGLTAEITAKGKGINFKVA